MITTDTSYLAGLAGVSRSFEAEELDVVLEELEGMIYGNVLLLLCKTQKLA